MCGYWQAGCHWCDAACRRLAAYGGFACVQWPLQCCLVPRWVFSAWRSSGPLLGAVGIFCIADEGMNTCTNPLQVPWPYFAAASVLTRAALARNDHTHSVSRPTNSPTLCVLLPLLLPCRSTMVRSRCHLRKQQQQQPLWEQQDACRGVWLLASCRRQLGYSVAYVTPT